MSENRFFETMQRQAGEIQTGGGGGLQPIELTATYPESGDFYIFTDMTDEIWEQLKTGNYYIKLTLPITDDMTTTLYVFINSWMNSDGLEGILSSSNGFGDYPNIYILFLKIKLTDKENYSYIFFPSENGYIPNLSGDAEGVSEKIIKYVAKSGGLGELSNVYVNSSWYVGTIDPIIWDGNQYIAYLDNITSDFINKKYLTLGQGGSPDNQITLLLKIKIDSIYYSLSMESNSTSTFTIINDDLSITVVSFKLIINGNDITIEIKAVKDKTDITETFKNSITYIDIYAL